MTTEPTSSQSPEDRSRGTQLCGGCRKEGRCRLGVGAFHFDGLSTSAPAVCASLFHAGPGVAHGGWTAAVFDDIMGRSLAQRGLQVVTASLTVDFLKPVPVDEELVVEVTIEAHSGRRWELSSILRLIGDDSALACARGVWIERRQDHFEQHRAAIANYRNSKSGNN